MHISIVGFQSYKNWACSICLPQAPACTSGSPSNWVCIAGNSRQQLSLNNKLSALPVLCCHAFVPDSVAVHFRVHSVLGSASLQHSSLVMLVLVGLCLLARHALFGRGRQQTPHETHSAVRGLVACLPHRASPQLLAPRRTTLPLLPATFPISNPDYLSLTVVGAALCCGVL